MLNKINIIDRWKVIEVTNTSFIHSFREYTKIKKKISKKSEWCRFESILISSILLAKIEGVCNWILNVWMLCTV